MKASELIKKLEGYEDFELEFSFYDTVLEPIYLEKKICWPPYRWLMVTGIADIGYSDKVIILDGDLR